LWIGIVIVVNAGGLMKANPAGLLLVPDIEDMRQERPGSAHAQDRTVPGISSLIRIDHV
jgi:hypothetical protein